MPAFSERLRPGDGTANALLVRQARAGGVIQRGDMPKIRPPPLKGFIFAAKQVAAAFVCNTVWVAVWIR